MINISIFQLSLALLLNIFVLVNLSSAAPLAQTINIQGRVMQTAVLLQQTQEVVTKAVSDDPYSEDEEIEDEEEEPERQGMLKSGTLRVAARAKPHHDPAGGAITAATRQTGNRCWWNNKSRPKNNGPGRSADRGHGFSGA